MNRVGRLILALEWGILGRIFFEKEIYFKIYVKKTLINVKPFHVSLIFFSINRYKIAKFEYHTIILQTQSAVFMFTLYGSYININYIIR
jgi:hypothetical protein